MLDTKKLSLTLLLVVPLMGAPEMTDSRPNSLEEEEPAENVLSGEHLPDRHPDLEDPEVWDDSGEVVGEAPALFRRRRSLDAPEDLSYIQQIVFKPGEERIVTLKPPQEESTTNTTGEDVEETFSPRPGSIKKKESYDECQGHLEVLKNWRKEHPNTSYRYWWKCNEYCCYPVLYHVTTPTVIQL